MTPEQAIEVTKAMQEMGVAAFELGELRVQFHPQLLTQSLPVAPRAEDTAKLQSELNERLMFGSSM